MSLCHTQSASQAHRLVATLLFALLVATSPALAQRVVVAGAGDDTSLAAGDDLIQAVHDVQNFASPFFGQVIHLLPPNANPGPWYYTIRPSPIGDNRFDAGTGLPKIFRPVTIIGDALTAQCQRRVMVIQAQTGQLLRLFFVRPDPSTPIATSLTLQNVVLERGNLPDSGGAIYLDQAALTMTDCIARNNQSTVGRGGAIFATRKDQPVVLELLRTNFLNNAAAVSGGAVHAQMTANVSGCLFSGNSAGPSPGFASGDGGAFYSSAFNLTMQPAVTCSGAGSPIPTEFVSNRAALGGAVYNNAIPQATGPLNPEQFRLFREVRFRSNQATFTGGAVHNFQATGAGVGLLFQKCRFGEINASNQAVAGTGNIAGSLGGAIFNNSTSSPFIVFSLFAGNSVAEVALPGSGEPIGRGGAIASLLTCRPIIRQCEFIENTALRDGGAVSSQSDGCRTTIDDSVFLRNRAGAPGSPGGDNGRGGGVYTGGSAVSFLHNCAFASNIAAQGGAMANENSGSCLVLHCTLSASQRGGGVYNLGASSTDSIGREFVNSIIWGNRLTGAGNPVTDVASFSFTAVSGQGPSLSVDYSDLDAAAAGHPVIVGMGNINCDPLHVNPTIGNLHLTQCSPCIDRANEARRQLVFATTSAFSTANLSGSGLSATLVGFIPPFVQTNDYDDNGTEAGNFNYADLIDPRPVTPRVQQCEVDMGADESLFAIEAQLDLFCRGRAPGNSDLLDCDMPGTLIDQSNCTYCEGEDVFLQAELETECPEQFVVRWYKCTLGPTECAAAMPAVLCTDAVGPSPACGTLVYEEVVPVGGISTFCINDASPMDTGCYCAYLTRESCGPSGLPKAPGCFQTLLGEEQTCVGQLVECVYIRVEQSPIPKPIPPASVCVGGTQELCSVVNVPVGCELQCSWYRVVGTPDDPTLPGFPVDDMLINCAAPPVGVQCIDRAGPMPNQRECCLRFTNATELHEGCYYVRATCGGTECDYFSAPACLTVYRQPVITTQPAPRTSCVNGMQQLCLTANSPDGQPLQIDWFRLTSCSEPIPEDPDNAPNRVCTTMCQMNPPAAGTPQVLCCTITAPTMPGNYFYKAVIRICDPNNPLKCPAVVSDCVTLTVVDPRPCVESRLMCVGGTQCLSVNPATLPGLPAGYNYTFRWYHLGAADCTFPTCATCTENPTAHGVACTGGTMVNDGVINGGTYSGATTSTLRLTNGQLDHRGQYYVQIGLDSNGDNVPETDKCMANSNCACLIIINPMPDVDDATVCEGGTQYLELASPLPTLPCDYSYVYQWFFAGTSACVTDANCLAANCPTGTALVDNARYTGVDTDRLCIMGATADERGCYYVRVTISGPNSCVSPAGVNCQVNSTCACLNVIPRPSISVQPEDAAVCIGSRQQIMATVTYSGNLADLCYEWYKRDTPCPMNPTESDGSLVSNGGGISGADTPTLTFDPAAAVHEGYYFLCVRVCMFGGVPIDDLKCPAVYSGCAFLDVRNPPVPCPLLCTGVFDPAAQVCRYCPNTCIEFCCDVVAPEGELCYQWYYSETPCDPSVDPMCVQAISGETGQCLSFKFDPDLINMPGGPGCYYVKINYSDLPGTDCAMGTDKCDPVFSDPICIDEVIDECCEIECVCKDNSTTVQDFYAFWRTGEWDGLNAEWSFDRTTTDGLIIKAADDFYLHPKEMHHITQFTGKMLIRQANSAIAKQAKLRFYDDCNGAPGELIEEFDSDCAAPLGAGLNGFSLVQFQFFLDEECFWLRGGIYWVSLVAIAPPEDSQFEAAWVTAGDPSDPSGNPGCGADAPTGACCMAGVCSTMTQSMCAAVSGVWYGVVPCTSGICEQPRNSVLGKRPQTMNNGDPWMEYDPCCHPCDDFVFCLSGKSCPVIWDNGRPYLGGAMPGNPASPPVPVFGTRSEKSVLPVRDSRAADQFIVKTCDGEEEVCYFEGYIFTNCPSFEVHLEIYENNCNEPDFVIPGGVPFYHTINVQKVDLGINGLKVDTTSVRAYKVFVCDFENEPLTLQPGQNYWVSLSVRDSFSSAERAFFAHVLQPCDPCDDPSVWKINPGMEIAPGRQIPNWRPVDADFAFLVATKKRVDRGIAPGLDPEICVADPNGDGVVAVDDIFFFLSQWFAGCP